MTAAPVHSLDVLDGTITVFNIVLAAAVLCVLVVMWWRRNDAAVQGRAAGLIAGAAVGSALTLVVLVARLPLAQSEQPGIADLRTGLTTVDRQIAALEKRLGGLDDLPRATDEKLSRMNDRLAGFAAGGTVDAIGTRVAASAKRLDDLAACIRQLAPESKTYTISFADGTPTRESVQDAVLDARREPYDRIAVTGHADAIGNPAKNLKVSQDRADTIKAYLVSEGLRSDTIDALGLGQTAPRYDPADKRNRRAEITMKRRPPCAVPPAGSPG